MSSQSLSCTESHVTMITFMIPNIAMNKHVLVKSSFLLEPSATTVFRTDPFQGEVLFRMEILGVRSVVMPDKIPNDFETFATNFTTMR